MGASEYAMITIISHFYNEQFLLPYFIDHHKHVVDHAVMIDYHSTDRSVEIIKEMAPSWEIRTSRNKEFESDSCDHEVMLIEQEFTGWKCALNVTEFLFHHDLQGYLNNWALRNPGVSVGMKGIIMVDHPNLKDVPAAPVEEAPLCLQRNWGYFDDDFGMRHPRYIHNNAHGNYAPGRHHTYSPSSNRDDIFILWWALSPLVNVLPRRKQIAARVAQKDKDRGRGLHHLMDDAALEEHYKAELAKSYDLRKDFRFASALANWRKAHNV